MCLPRRRVRRHAVSNATSRERDRPRVPGLAPGTLAALAVPVLLAHAVAQVLADD